MDLVLEGAGMELVLAFRPHGQQGWIRCMRSHSHDETESLITVRTLFIGGPSFPDSNSPEYTIGAVAVGWPWPTERKARSGVRL